MNHLYRRMTESNSLLRIEYLAEDALTTLGRCAATDAEGTHRSALERIRTAETLDEAHALAYEAMGCPEQAGEIRRARAARKARMQGADGLASLIDFD